MQTVQKTETILEETFGERLHQMFHPDVWSDLVGNEETIEKIRALVESGEPLPHLMFVGPPGVGKTALAQLIARLLNGKNWKSWYREKNGSNDNSIKKIRDEIVPYLQGGGKVLKNRKILFVDEAENYTRNAQKLLRPELQTTKVLVIFATNYPYEFEKAVRNRFFVFEFHPVEVGQIMKRLRFICKKMKIDTTNGALKAIAEFSEGSVRTAVNKLEVEWKSSRGKKLTEESINVVKPDSQALKRILQSISYSKYKEVREQTLTYLESNPSLTVRRFILHLYGELTDLKLPDSMIGDLTACLGDGDYRIVSGGTEGLQLVTMLAKMCRASKKYSKK